MAQITKQITSLYTMKLNSEKSSEINAPSNLEFTALSLQLIPTAINEKLEAGVNQDKLNQNLPASFSMKVTISQDLMDSLVAQDVLLGWKLIKSDAPDQAGEFSYKSAGNGAEFSEKSLIVIPESGEVAEEGNIKWQEDVSLSLEFEVPVTIEYTTEVASRVAGNNVSFYAQLYTKTKGASPVISLLGTSADALKVTAFLSQVTANTTTFKKTDVTDEKTEFYVGDTIIIKTDLVSPTTPPSGTDAQYYKPVNSFIFNQPAITGVSLTDIFVLADEDLQGNTTLDAVKAAIGGAITGVTNIDLPASESDPVQITIDGTNEEVDYKFKDFIDTTEKTVSKAYVWVVGVIKQEIIEP